MKPAAAPSRSHSSATLSRRDFLRRTATAGAGLLILRNSRSAFAYDANNKLNIAAIGAGGRARGNVPAVAKLGENIVALCDVDATNATTLFEQFPNAKRFTDFRRMFDALGKSIDAVIISTPDHTHATAAAAAIRRGQHVYCEKPLTRTVHEARVLRLLAREHKIVTQMGNQGSASNGLRRAVELAWSGLIGDIHEAHVWFPNGNGPRVRPTDMPPVPAGLDWDLWLGPAPVRPYHPEYAPAKWRNWRAFGSGIVGDFGCHTSNIMFRALKLEELWNPPGPNQPKQIVIRVEALPSERDLEGYPLEMEVRVQLPARGAMPPVKLGFHASGRPSPDLMLGYPQGKWGDLLVGTKGAIYSDNPWNTGFALLPESKFDEIKHGPPQTLPANADHHREWVDACKGIGKTFSSFEIGGPMTELMQLINLSTLREEALEYDTLSGRILNSRGARQLLHRDYRRGWVL